MNPLTVAGLRNRFFGGSCCAFETVVQQNKIAVAAKSKAYLEKFSRIVTFLGRSVRFILKDRALGQCLEELFEESGSLWDRMRILAIHHG